MSPSTDLLDDPRLPAPVITDAMHPLLPDETAWLLSRFTQQSPLRVTIEKPWVESRGSHTLEFFVDDLLVHTRTLFYPSSEWVFPLISTIDRFDMSRAGIFRLHYRVTLPLGPSDISESVSFNLDKTAPNVGSAGPELSFPDAIVLSGVTDSYLAEHDDKVIATIDSGWPDIRLQDKITVQWLRVGAAAGVDTVSTFEQVILTEADKVAPIQVVFSGDFLRENTNGRFVAEYYLTDRAGNGGPASRVSTIEVDLTLPPTGLLRPLIPQADDGLIDRGDACDGVWVVIRAYNGPKAGDEIVLTVNSTELAPYPVTALTVFPVSIELPWDYLSAYYEQDTAVVWYRVKRGAYISAPSPVLNVDIDLRLPGPPNPDPCPPNTSLEALVVRGGGPYPFDNLITPLDIDQPATATVHLYANPQAGEVLTLCWGDAAQALGTYTVQPGDAEGDLITLNVDWDTINNTGNQAAWPVFYRVSHPLNDNWQEAPHTAVVIMLTPGTGEYLPEARFVHMNENNYINCSTVPPPSAGIALHLPAGAHFAGASKLYLFWRGYKGVNLTDPRPQTNHMFDLPVPPDAVSAGVHFTVGSDHDEFVRLVQPIGFEWGAGNNRQNGSAEVFYIVLGAGGALGMSQPRRAYCSLELVPPGSKCPCDGLPHDDEEWCAPAP